MADRPPEVCAFCKEGDEAGELRNTTDDDILAHYNCLLYSPRVVSTPMKDSQDSTTEFDIKSVKKEIHRGDRTKCSLCGKKGATIGCDVKQCNKTYHYKCVKKDGGIYIKDEENEIYIIYCEQHADEKNRTKKNETPKSLKRSRGTPTLKRKSTIMHALRKKRRLHRISDRGKENDDSRQSLTNQTSADDMEEPCTSGTHKQHGIIRSDTESELSDSSPANRSSCGESDNDTSAGELKKTLHHSSFENSLSSSSSESMFSPKITRAISISGFPKKNKKRTKKSDNPDLEEALPTMPPDEKKAYSLLYDEVGGSLNMSQEWLTAHNDLNDNQTDIEDYETDVPASTVFITPETQSASSALETSISKLGSPSANSTGTTSRQHDTTINETSKNHLNNVTNTEKQGCMILQLEDHSYCSSSDNSAASQPEDTSDGIDSTCSPMDKSAYKPRFSINSTVSLDIQHKVSNSKGTLAAPPVDLDHAKTKMAKELFNIFENFIKENKNIIMNRNAYANTLHEDPVKASGITKPSDEEQLNNSQNFSNKSCIKPLFPTNASGLLEGHTIKLLDEQPSGTNTSNEQHKNTLCISKQLNEHLTSPLTSKMSDEQPKNLPSNNMSTVFAKEQTPLEHKSETHSSFSTIGTSSLFGQPSQPLKFPKNDLGSPRSENTTHGKSTLFRPLLSFSPEALPASSGSSDVRGAKTSLHGNNTPNSPYLSPLQLKEISTHLRNGSFSKTFNSMVPQIQSTIESAKKTQPQIKDDKIRSEGSIETNTSLEQTEKQPTNSNEQQNNSDDEASSEGLSISSQQTARHLHNLDANQINTGFPSAMELCLNNERKSLLMESYKRIQEQIKMSNVMETGAARAFWSLCLESKCREFLLTMLLNYTKSVINKIMHEDPEDRDFELAFALLQASGCFEDVIKVEDSHTRLTSSMDERETSDDSSFTSSPSIPCGHTELDGQETSSNRNNYMVELELPKASLYSERCVEERTRDEDNERMEACSPAASLPSSSVRSAVTEIHSQSQTLGGNHMISEVQLTLMKMMQDLNSQRLQQQEDGDTAFARSLVPFLRKVPEDKKLPTRIAIQNIILSALSQNPQLPTSR